MIRRAAWYLAAFLTAGAIGYLIGTALAHALDHH